MIVLALDSSLDACSAAVYRNGQGVLAQRLQMMERGQAEAIAPMARDVMAEAGLAFDRIDRIAVTLGPGTFTGIRIGLACAKGLALTLQKPLIGLDTLRAIAANADETALPIVVANDARQERLYLGIYRKPDETILAPRRVSLAEALALLPNDAFIVMGNAKGLIAAARPDDAKPNSARDIPIAANFAALAAGANPDSAPLRPLYLAESYAKLPKPRIDVAVAQADDATLLAALHGACFDPGWSTVDLARLLAMPGALGLIARQNGRPAAFLLIRSAADEAEILTIATQPDARRQGLGAKLIEAALDLLRKDGISRLMIEVADSNEAALALYRKIGFAAVGRRQAYYERADGRREDAAIMRKDIGA